jgi:diadenylate cyclase
LTAQRATIGRHMLTRPLPRAVVHELVRWQSVIDFVVLAVAIYILLRCSRDARALTLTLTILAFRVGALLSRQLDLLITSWVLDASTIVGLLALVIVFQPELRRALMQLDVTGHRHHRRHVPALSAISEATWSLARVRCGALIVIARKDSLSELVTPGTVLDGQLSAEMLEAIFRKDSPIHDGAAIIEADVIARVGSILPLTQRSQVPGKYGTRHRAAMGLSDRSDAIVVVVSEERGDVTLMWEGRARQMGNPDELHEALQTLVPDRQGRVLRHRWSPPQQLGLKTAAVALAALVWGVTFLFPGRSVRERTVPVEFTNVPPGMTIADQSTDVVQVWLRGTDFLFESVNLNTVVARCDLSTAHEGANTVPLRAGAFDIPFGLRIEGIAPSHVSVRLAGSSTTREGNPDK